MDKLERKLCGIIYAIWYYIRKKIDRHLEYIDNKINEYFEQLEDEDDPVQQQNIHNKITHQATKADHYLDISKNLDKQNLDQISTIDPDAKAVILHRNIVNVGYNIQAASDGLAIDTGDTNDTHALAIVVEQVQTNLQIRNANILADKGYHTGEQLSQCEKLGVTTFISPKASAVNNRFKVFPMSDFTYHPGSDTYRCPNNSILRSNGKTYQRKGPNKKGIWVKFKHYRTKDCKYCSIKGQCTSAPNGRIVQRSEHQSAIDRNNNRINDNPDYYRNRQQIIEHQFGTIKGQWHFDHVLMRGKQNVLAETSILFTAYNLKRSMSILGFSELINALKAFFRTFSLIFTLTEWSMSLTEKNLENEDTGTGAFKAHLTF